ncbi:DUF2255 family protein [Actinospica durhamensis]|uniref:DUF2255 family protein n=1 Tax=Actinospica durhamensis TaxID=1508375 RepID=A0A941EWP9_9ACTN|nr:DUF2255 family protein [Actinospica durhamensis]MBR7839245.1 DUF2255 family protein [Actinospica durhamensis]
MTTWTGDELSRIEQDDELEVAPVRGDGAPHAPLPVWFVRDGEDLFIRSFHGESGVWYRAARASHEGRIQCGDVAKDVTFVEADDPGLNDRIDAAYRTKYGRFGARYVDSLVAARDTTLQLMPR